ncbi:hypothetical protein ACWDKQ_10635 [Saccharopolyspora sp. NPDC000995]
MASSSRSSSSSLPLQPIDDLDGDQRRQRDDELFGTECDIGAWERIHPARLANRLPPAACRLPPAACRLPPAACKEFSAREGLLLNASDGRKSGLNQRLIRSGWVLG